MKKHNFDEAKKDAFRRLEKLPKNLYFHNPPHTEDVLEVVERLAPFEGIGEYELLLLKTAAVYHDTGHLFGPKEHEKMSVRIAKSALPTYGYNAKGIDTISGMIMATQMPQKPRTPLQKILCDADLDNFGREDFYVKGELLRLELAKQGVKISPRNWYTDTLKLLEDHNYHTDSAKRLRQKGKEQHIQEIKELLRIK